MAAQVKFCCVKCGEHIESRPEVVMERNEQGQERLFPTWENVCEDCRMVAFYYYREWDKEVRRDG